MPTRYHPALVALHWLLALMILGLLFGGNFLLEPVPNSDPDKVFGFTNHMIGGVTVGTLMIVRLLVRLFTKTPPHAETGSAALDLAGRAAHWGLYLLVFAMVGSGIALSQTSGLGEIVFFGGEGPLPPDFSAFPARAVHGVISILLMALILAHLAGWAYHSFVLKDGLIRRMWFGKRNAG